MNMRERHLSLGATVAADGIPLEYGNLRFEYRAALEQAVLMERSHEGRITARGRDRFNLIHRISTNDVMNLAVNEGRATIFTNATGRILDRAVVYDRGEDALILTEPGRGTGLLNYLQRQVFFNDDAIFTDLTPVTVQFSLHGPAAAAIMETIAAGAAAVEYPGGIEAFISGVPVYLARKASLVEYHWVVIAPQSEAVSVWDALMEAGAAHGLLPAGSLTYNILRIRAGRPGVGRELTQDYIPLEAGLWDEVSFSKGCYTGQEIIARMESRGRLAKTMIRLGLSAAVEAPAELFHEGKTVGKLTSSVVTPDGEALGIGFVKVPLAVPEQLLYVGQNSVQAKIIDLAGAQPPQLVTS